jgi:hypothetical protein
MAPQTTRDHPDDVIFALVGETPGQLLTRLPAEGDTWETVAMSRARRSQFTLGRGNEAEEEH